MSDNLAQIRTNYEKSLADYQADRTNALNTLTTASFFGGLGLVLLVAMLGLMRIVSGLHLWVAAIGATTCCLIIGAILMDPGRLATRQDAAVAFSSYPTSPPKPNDSQESKVADVCAAQSHDAFGGSDRVRRDPVLESPIDRRPRRQGVDRIEASRRGGSLPRDGRRPRRRTPRRRPGRDHHPRHR